MAEEYTYELKIPKERVAVLIGRNGEVKKKIEAETGIILDIDSEEGDVTIKGNDPIKLYSAQDIIKAVGRGFNPEIALLMTKADYSFDIIDITDFAKTQNDMLRLKGRIIGQDGKSRRTIEELTETHICVYGKTVGIIGEVSRVSLTRRAVESLLSGSPHANVYHWLEKQRHNIKRSKLAGDEESL